MPWKLIELNEVEIKIMRREYSSKARFHLDEGMDPEIASVLKNRGFNVKTARELGLTGHPDDDHFATAYRKKSILLTHDEDFLDDRKFPPHRSPGVVVLPQGVDAIIPGIWLVLTVIAPNRKIWKGTKVKITSDGYIRVWNYDERGSWSQTRYKYGRHAMIWTNEN
jgi:hypothetical protein